MRVTKSFFTLTTIFALVSCSNEWEQTDTIAQLQLTTDIASTRADINATHFDHGDAIGVFAYKGRSSSMESWNVKATTDSKSWYFEKPVTLFRESTTVYAYYPWNGYASDKHMDGFVVDATTQTNYMVGYDEDISYSNPKALITFRHITAKVSFYITYSDTGTGIENVTLNGEKLPLSGAYTIGKGFGSLAANNMKIYSRNISTLTAGRQKAEFLLLPYASSCSATLNVTYEDGAIYSTDFTLPALAENCSYAYNVNISKVSMEISDAVIAPWDTPATMDEIVMGSTSLIGSENGHDYVDLGLPSGMLWATCNVGAAKPEDYGGYYAWGETEEKNNYISSTYKYYYKNDFDEITKYCNNSSYAYIGYPDNRTVLEAGDDVAHVKWGGNWRMPTDVEWEELSCNCTWTWIIQNGVNGYMITSKKDGFSDMSIFLPAAGFRNNYGLTSADSRGLYWSSSLYESYPFCACVVDFDSGNYDRSYVHRINGLSVRPVCP